MSKVHVVVDSTANIPQEMLDKYDNLHVIPLNVSFGDKHWRDGEVALKELFNMVESTGSLPCTSQPAPGEFISVFEPILKSGSDIVVITIDGALSGTIHSARTAASMLNANNIYVVDSWTTAIGMLRMARTALELAEAGKSAKEIAKYVEKEAAATHTIFTVDTLRYLHKGGRIGGAAALIGSILQIKPILHLVDGKVAVFDKVRSKPKAVKRMLEELNKYNNIKEIGVVHLEVWDEAYAFKEMIQKNYPDIPVTVSDGGAVLASHLGPGVLGIIFEESF